MKLQELNKIAETFKNTDKMRVQRKEYSNGEITIVWLPKRCMHSGICVKTLPNVYNPKERPWIKPFNASTEELINQVAMCPSGALSIKELNMIEIKQIQKGNKGHFAAIDDSKVAGRMFYTFAGKEKMIIDHTEVDNAYRGQNIGNKILMSVVEFARENKIKIIPLCPFAKSVFDKTESIRDVL